MMIDNGCAAKVVCINEDTNVSSLPEHIHHLILSLGTLRDAVKTAALSTEWRHCYRSLSNLEFTDRDMLALGMLPREFFHKSLTVQNSIFKEITSKFIGSVNAFLQSTTITRVETFAVSFSFFDENGHHLDEWIRFAIASGAKELDLELKVLGELYTKYKFPLDLFAGGRECHLIRLRLCHCIFPSMRDIRGFIFLKKFVLDCVLMTEKELHCFLSKCTALEWLQVSSCAWLLSLKISHFSSKLKYLKVSNCSNVKKIIISASNLETLEYDGRKVKFIIENVPKLLRARIFFAANMFCGIDDILTGLANDLPQLETLFLQFNDKIKDGCLPSYPSNFINLKHLVVTAFMPYDRQLLWLGLLLDAAPFVENFHLDLWNLAPQLEEDYVDIERETVRPTKRNHNHLREVMISGFNGFISEMELVKYILHNAVALKLMRIDPSKKHYRGEFQWYHGTPKKGALVARQNAKKLLSVAPPSVKIVIL